MARATSLPLSVSPLCGPRGGGASSVMKSLNNSTPAPSSLSVGTGLAASSAQLPCGQFSLGKMGLVMPISFK